MTLDFIVEMSSLSSRDCGINMVIGVVEHQ